MRFSFGPPPNSLSADELASGDWQRVRLLPMWAVQLLAVPVGAVISVLLFAAWTLLTPKFDVDFDDSMRGMWVALATLLLGPLLQVAAHHPAGFFGNSVLGLWASRLAVYTGTTDKVSRGRYLLVLSLPFLLLAVGPLIFVMSTRVQSGWLIYVSCVAALAFGINAVMALWAARQIPAGALVAGIGFQTYWRVPAPRATSGGDASVLTNR